MPNYCSTRKHVSPRQYNKFSGIFQDWLTLVNDTHRENCVLLNWLAAWLLLALFMFAKLIKFYSFITYSYQIHSVRRVFMWHPVERFQHLLLKTKPFLKKLGYRFLAESTKIENATFPYKTATSEASVKTNRTEIHKWTYHKEQRFPSNYFQKQLLRGFLRNFEKFTGKYLHQILRCAGLQLYFKKETLAQMFSCEFSETCKNTFFTAHLYFFKKLGFSLRTSYIKSCFNVPTTQMLIFINFASAGILFEGVFLPVSLLKK